jgi:hypothetical protein
MSAALAFEFAIIPVAQQGVVVGIRFEPHASAVPAISTRWAASRNIFFPPERHAAVPAVPSFHRNFRFINKHSNFLLPRKYSLVK